MPGEGIGGRTEGGFEEEGNSGWLASCNHLNFRKHRHALPNLFSALLEICPMLIRTSFYRLFANNPPPMVFQASNYSNLQHTMNIKKMEGGGGARFTGSTENRTYCSADCSFKHG